MSHEGRSLGGLFRGVRVSVAAGRGRPAGARDDDGERGGRWIVDVDVIDVFFDIININLIIISGPSGLLCSR